jgi:hypothetical protein
MNLEQSPNDKECINTIFRPFHTLKGSLVSQSSGYQSILSRHGVLTGQGPESSTDHHPGDDRFHPEAVDLRKEMILDLKTHIEQGQFTHGRFDLEPYFQRIAFLEKGEPGGDPRKTEAVVVTPKPPLGRMLSTRGIVSESDVDEALEKQAQSEGSQDW